MTKPTVIFTRPAQWGRGNCRSAKLKLVHAPVFGNYPRLRNGEPMGDNVGGVATRDGLDKLVELFHEHNPDVFLYWATYYDDNSINQLSTVVATLKQLREQFPNTLFIYGNGNQQGYPDFNVEAFKFAIDLLLTNTRDAKEYEMYKEYGIPNVGTFYTFGFDPTEHGKFFGIKESYDCFFGGSQSFNPARPVKYPKSVMRLEFLKAVNERFKLLVHGKGFWPFKVYPYLYARDYYKVFGRAKIALGMYHWNKERYYTKRTIYSLASGKCFITHYIPGMEKDFTNHQHLVWFTTIEEALDVIDFYLKNPERRERVGGWGRELAIQNHSWQARLKEFEKIVLRFF